MRIMLVVIFLMVGVQAYGQETKYEEVKDCPYPSKKELIGYDERGHAEYTIVQDSRCL